MPTVTCLNFERLINEQLDARAPAPAGFDEALASHAATCPRCREIDQRYRALRRALDAWEPAATPTIGLADRILAAHDADRRRPGRILLRPARAWWPAAAAVVLLSLGVYGLRTWLGTAAESGPLVAETPRPVEPTPTPAPNPLSVAFSEATAATLDLALETSAPAARVGRGVLASAAVARDRFSAPSIATATPSDILQSSEAGDNEGGRPLSGSARDAFGFLLPSSLGG